jgi:hypothetical protein
MMDLENMMIPHYAGARKEPGFSVSSDPGRVRGTIVVPLSGLVRRVSP